MAFTQNTAAAPSTNQANDSWKAAAFLNFYVNRADGTKRKVGAIPLKAGKNQDNALITRLQQEGAVQAFMDALSVDFQMVDTASPADAGF